MTKTVKASVRVEVRPVSHNKYTLDLSVIADNEIALTLFSQLYAELSGEIQYLSYDSNPHGPLSKQAYFKSIKFSSISREAIMELLKILLKSLKNFKYKGLAKVDGEMVALITSINNITIEEE